MPACRRSITATTSARWRKEEGFDNAFDFPGFVPAYIRPLFCRGIGPFRWAALSGDPEDIYRTDAKVRELTPGNTHLHNWLDMARERIAFQGLPARICWVGLGDRHRLGLAFNEMVAKGELKAPVVIGRDHLDSGSVASPNRETEAMKDGSDAVSDWPLLNALLNTASGATWVSLHHGGGVGMGFSQHAGMVIVADGTPEAARRLERVLWNDPATGVMRHADAGYDIAHRLRQGTPAQPARHPRLTDADPARRRLSPHAVEERRRRNDRDRHLSRRAPGSTISTGASRWRASRADGPFSLFPGVDRTLAILEGEGLLLDIAGRAPVELTGASAPLSFPADAPTTASLIAGPITDLNVMTRRGTAGAQGRPAAKLPDRSRSHSMPPRPCCFASSGDIPVTAGGDKPRSVNSTR